MFYEEKTTKSERIYEGRILNLRVDTVELPNMSYAHREIVEHAGSVLIIPIKDEDTVYMIKQYRKAVDQVLLEFPAGIIEDDEDPKETAMRELQEEIGYAAKDIKYISEVFASPGYSEEKIDIFLARDIYKSELEGDPDENIEIVEVSIADLEDLILSFEIQDAASLIAALYILLMRDKNRG